MNIFNEQEARTLLEKVVKMSKADECTATLGGRVAGNVRYALNNISTSGVVGDCDLVVAVAFGKRVGTSTINRFDDASLEHCVRRAEELAKLAPENPEFMPAIPKQDYKPTVTFFDKTAAVDPAYRAQVAADCILPCRSGNLVAAGFFTDTQGFDAVCNSNGNFGYQRSTSIDFTCTVRTADGRGSGWVARNVADAGRFSAKDEIGIAIDKAKRSVDAKALEPGKYTVVLEPAASGHLISDMMTGFDARQCDEGRSFLTKKGGGNRLGEKVFDERVTVYARNRRCCRGTRTAWRAAACRSSTRAWSTACATRATGPSLRARRRWRCRATSSWKAATSRPWTW